MKNFTLLLFFITSFVFSQEKALFIGNSMTYFNDMPILFQNIANNKGKNIESSMYAPGGTGFVNHVQDDNVYNQFRNQQWDYVILQPGTGESAGVSWPVNTTIERGQKLMDSIKKYSPCAKIFLYELPYGVPNETSYNTYFNIQTKFKDSVSKMADNLRVPMVAAGECARQHYSTSQDLLLHGSYNDIHPNLNGSYLVACAMYCTIFQETVSGCTYYGGVADNTATYFHGIADQIILQNKAQWRIPNFAFFADYSQNINASNVNFTNLSTNQTSVLWNFGDGITSTDTNPNHTYTSDGTYQVELKIFRTINNVICEESITKNIVINSLNSSQFTKEEYAWYVNNNELIIEGKENFEFNIFDISGKLLGSYNKTNSVLTIGLNNFSQGIYILKNNTTQSSNKFVVQ